jgi:hypothetical protein
VPPEFASRMVLAWPRVSGAALARVALPAVVLATLLFELALAERKYALFGGGFGQSQALEGPVEIAVFMAALLWCHALLFHLLYRLLRRLHGRWADRPVFQLNFLFIAGFGAVAVTIAKFQALAYFSDAMSFRIVRNLGGGSLADALLYSLSEASLIILGILGACAAYAGLLFVTRGARAGAPPTPDRRLSARRLAAILAATPLVLFAANQLDDARAALARMNAPFAVGSVLHALTDFDRDGYSLFSHPIDRHPFDAARHPYALDDEGGASADIASAIEDGPPPVIAGPRRHVILIVLESARGDAIGKRVAGRPVAPNLEALAAGGSHAAHAYSHVGFTTFSLQSLFTGRLAPVAGGPSLVRDFLANGYEVGIFSGQAEDFGGTAEIVGMREGAVFVDGEELKEERAFSFAAQGSINVDGRILLREFDRHMGRPEAWGRPNFLYFNFQSAHFPYHAPGMPRLLPGEPVARSGIKAANRDQVARTYWNAIAYNDWLVGQVMARLRRLGVLDRTLIVVTSDHGESLFDDGFLGHGHMLNEQQTRIPFILSDPGIALDGPIGLADMRAIILAAAGATVAPRAPAPGVFQYLGDLDRPGRIGMVDGAGEWILFDPARERVKRGEGPWTPYASLPEGGADKRLADALLAEWTRQRRIRRALERRL